jgi:hypothetical protein
MALLWESGKNLFNACSIVITILPEPSWHYSGPYPQTEAEGLFLLQN